MTRHFLEISDLSVDELREVLDLAMAPPTSLLSGRGVALLFEKPSARTRHSSEMAVVQLGGHPITVSAAEVDLDRRETAEDVARTFAQYHAAIGAIFFSSSVRHCSVGPRGNPSQILEFGGECGAAECFGRDDQDGVIPRHRTEDPRVR